MNDSSGPFELLSFEHVEAGPGNSLLRVSARGEVPAGSGSTAVLVDDGTAVRVLQALPAPPAPAGLIRYAFRAPTEVVRGGARFSLELPDGSKLELPAPADRAAAAAHAEAAPEAGAVAADGDRETAPQSVVDARAELERAWRFAGEQESRAEGLETELAAQRLRAQEARERAAELERRLERLTAELALALAARAESEETLSRLLAEGSGAD